jgi:hypothetical protein
MDVLRRCDCADKPNDTAQAVMLDMLVSRFCKALGEPIPEDAIRRAEQLAGAVKTLAWIASAVPDEAEGVRPLDDLLDRIQGEAQAALNALGGQ